ncbi:MAG: hypothetical protein Q7S74_05020 [Nanoarchaeota archaeon]|nr:hypothetical protein [Nanoarchaeota archaeon]
MKEQKNIFIERSNDTLGYQIRIEGQSETYARYYTLQEGRKMFSLHALTYEGNLMRFPKTNRFGGAPTKLESDKRLIIEIMKKAKSAASSYDNEIREARVIDKIN